MKIIKAFGFVLVILILCGASVWEGAGAVAVNGDLPNEGYYTATNSFPRNTVVDITNLETGKSIRVIVATGLDTPGLLAVLSKDAARVIGMQARSISRIKMVQPSDPIAFSRFTEGLVFNEDPDYNPAARIAAESAAVSAPVGQTEETPAPAAENDEFVDVPEFYYPPETIAEDEAVFAEPDLSWVQPEEKSEVTKNTGEAAGAETAAAGEETEAPALNEGPQTSLAEHPPESGAGTLIAEEPELIIEAPIVEEYGFTLIPAEEKPPANTELAMDESSFVEPVGPIGEVPAETAPNEIEIAEEDFIEPVGELPPALTEMPEEKPINAGMFSVPVISSLEYGKYYLQLGAFSKPESVENEIHRIGGAFPLSVQATGSAEKLLYRILVGPVNLGESGALLQRFKGSGYKDAFVRQGS
jgi:hypothetical protein